MRRIEAVDDEAPGACRSDTRPIVEPARTPTNMVFFDVARDLCTGPELCARLDRLGIRMIALDPHRVRAVTHLDVDRLRIEVALTFLEKAVAG